ACHVAASRPLAVVTPPPPSSTLFPYTTLVRSAAVSPLIGLLGTVVGMIEVFNVISVQGVGKAGAMAGGISKALITTAAGLIVAIPSLIAYRYFRRRVDTLILEMEQEALKLVEVIYGQRSQRGQSRPSRTGSGGASA